VPLCPKHSPSPLKYFYLYAFLTRTVSTHHLFLWPSCCCDCLPLLGKAARHGARRRRRRLAIVLRRLHSEAFLLILASCVLLCLHSLQLRETPLVPARPVLLSAFWLINITMPGCLAWPVSLVHLPWLQKQTVVVACEEWCTVRTWHLLQPAKLSSQPWALCVHGACLSRKSWGKTVAYRDTELRANCCRAAWRSLATFSPAAYFNVWLAKRTLYGLGCMAGGHVICVSMSVFSAGSHHVKAYLYFCTHYELICQYLQYYSYCSSGWPLLSHQSDTSLNSRGYALPGIRVAYICVSSSIIQWLMTISINLTLHTLTSILPHHNHSLWPDSIHCD